MQRRFTAILLVLIMLLHGLCALAEGASGQVTGGESEGVEWSFQNGVLTLKGEGPLTDRMPWEGFRKETEELVLGSAFPEQTDWAGFSQLGKLKKVVYETDYCSAYFADSKDLKEVRYCSEQPRFLGMAYIACRLESITFDNPEADYRFEGNLLLNRAGTELFYCLGSKAGTVTVPEGVEIIHEGAFAGCIIRSLSLPDTLKTIEAFAFSDCRTESVTIPASCERIGAGAFAGCSMKKIEFAGSHISFSADTYGFRPGETFSRGGYTFDGCTNLQKVTLPGCDTIPECFFRGCKSLRRVDIGEGTKEIPSYRGIFEGCNQLTTVFIPDDTRFDGKLFLDMKAPLILCHEDSEAGFTVLRNRMKHKFIAR